MTAQLIFSLPAPLLLLCKANKCYLDWRYVRDSVSGICWPLVTHRVSLLLSYI